MKATCFDKANDWPDYQAWRDAQPGGLVLNMNKTPKQNYLVLHRAPSTCLNHPNPTLRYSKLCGTEGEIKDYLAKHFLLDPQHIRRCQRCFAL